MNGWNEDRLESVISILDDAGNTLYEIKNCIRGCFTGAKTYKELQTYLNSLADNLHNAAEWMNTEEDDEEE